MNSIGFFLLLKRTYFPSTEHTISSSKQDLQLFIEMRFKSVCLFAPTVTEPNKPPIGALSKTDKVFNKVSYLDN